MALAVNIHNKRKNPEVNDYVRDRVEMVIGRFADRIGHIDVHIVDENDAKGGDDKICTVDIKLRPTGQLHVRAKRGNVYAAIVKAVHRAETLVAKTVERGHRSHDARRRSGRPEWFAEHVEAPPEPHVDSLT